MHAIDQLISLGDPENAVKMAAYHKVSRKYLGVTNPQIDTLVREWRTGMDMTGRTALADRLWQSNIHEARIAAAKLLTQARISDDQQVWTLIAGWVPDFDAWAIADHTMSAASRRLTADPERLDQVSHWISDTNMWVRRAALVGTLPWAKMNNPKPADLTWRENVLGWAAALSSDHEWFIQKAIAWWLRDLSKRDAPRVLAFLAEHGAHMKPFAKREATRLIKDR